MDTRERFLQHIRLELNQSDLTAKAYGRYLEQLE